VFARARQTEFGLQPFRNLRPGHAAVLFNGLRQVLTPNPTLTLTPTLAPQTPQMLRISIKIKSKSRSKSKWE